MTASQPTRAGVLLTDADYYGTLAAARLLGSQGIGVTVAQPGRAAPASWSRYVRRTLCPPLTRTGAFLEWAMVLGEREPGLVFYPTSDDFAWFIAANREELSQRYLLYSPSIDVMERVLDKGTLHQLCARVGIDTPTTWCPETDAELEAIARAAPFPLLIKQRTQVLSATHSKGVIVAGPEELKPKFHAFVRVNTHGSAIARRRPEACQPMIQAICPPPAEGTLLVAGFVDREGRVVAARASHKILQRPRRLGIALCLNEAPIEPDLEQRLGALCREAGYHGVFHVEFIPSQGRYLLIDFNPRYYHHLAFEIARGMPLPMFTYHGATGDDAALARAGEAARACSIPDGRVFTHWLDFQVMVRGRETAGRMSRDEAERWRRWSAQHRARMVDAVLDRSDPLPSLVDTAVGLTHWLRHPRSFIRRIILER